MSRTRHPLKAYLSDRDARELHTTPCYNLTLPSVQALNELHELLAETEQDSAEYTPCDGYQDLGECWIANPREGNAHAALMEALAAFVNDGGRQ
jgi:hypothetical protein